MERRADGVGCSAVCGDTGEPPLPSDLSHPTTNKHSGSFINDPAERAHI